jgi:hypothetical protein
MPVEAEPAAETGGLSDEDYLALRKALSSEGLARTSSARERAAARALAAEAGRLDTQTALDARELAAVRAEMLALRAAAAAADGEPERSAVSEAQQDSPLDELPDEAVAVICRHLGLRELGRLACVSRRFTEPTLTEPGGGGAGGAKLSPIEEGARLAVVAGGGSGGGSSGGGGASGGAAAVRLADETWMRVLWRVQYRLLFTSCGPQVVLSEEGALRLRAAEGSAAAHDTVLDWGSALGHPRRRAFTQDFAA